MPLKPTLAALVRSGPDDRGSSDSTWLHLDRFLLGRDPLSRRADPYHHLAPISFWGLARGSWDNSLPE